jgi:hypothetical protein
MNIITRGLKEIFDFFCGDWRIFWGVVVSILLIELIERIEALAFARPIAAVIFILGISLSLLIALKREIRHE